ncbi:molecular chaperone DnaJ [Crenothrix sp. D3]|nr:molecular chaperone DnaJ [Crenothrix sp. D3]
MLPEEQELNRLESEQAILEDQVISAELTLETLKAESAQFQYYYYQTVGRLYVELDDLIAQIARVEAGLEPDNTEAQAQAKAAEEQAQRTAEEAGVAEKQPQPPAKITPELKQVIQKARKLMFPDHFPADSDEHKRRSAFMAQVNVAFDKRDQAAIEKLMLEFSQDPEAIKGEDVGSRLVRVFRSIALLRIRATEVEQEIALLKQSEIIELMTTITEAKALGGDPLADLAQQIMQQISECKIELEMIRQQRMARV